MGRAREVRVYRRSYFAVGSQAPGYD